MLCPLSIFIREDAFYYDFKGVIEMDEDPGGSSFLVSIFFMRKNKERRPFYSSHGPNK